MKRVLIISIILLLLCAGMIAGYHFFIVRNMPPQLVPEEIYVPTPTPIVEQKTEVIYMTPAPTIRPTVDPYWVPGPWGEFNFG